MSFVGLIFYFWGYFSFSICGVVFLLVGLFFFFFFHFLFSLKKKGMVWELSEINGLHFSVSLRSFASHFSFLFPFSTRPAGTGMLKNSNHDV